MSLLPGGGAVLEWIRRLIAGCRAGARPGRGGVQGGPVQHHRPTRVEQRPLAGRLPRQLGADAGRRRAARPGDVTGQPKAVAVLRLALMLLLVLNLVALGLLLAELRAPLSRTHGPRALAVLAALVVLAGSLVPLLLLALRATGHIAGAALFMLLGAVVAPLRDRAAAASAGGGREERVTHSPVPPTGAFDGCDAGRARLTLSGATRRPRRSRPAGCPQRSGLSHER